MTEPSGGAVERRPLAGEPRMLIDGELVDAADGATFEVIDPSDGSVAGICSDGGIAEVDRAVAAARRAFDATQWSRDVAFRHHCVTQLLTALRAEKERMRRILVTEIGTPIATTHSIQLEVPIAEIAHWAEYGRSFGYWRDTGVHTSMYGSSRRIEQHEAVGVVAVITPWNVPLFLDVAQAVPALMAGNAVVLKPAQLTPWSGTELGRLVAEYTDFPPGIFQVLTSNANEVGAALASAEGVDMVAFTGSTAVGRKVLGSASMTVKKVVLELGGKSSHIVLDDADLAATLPAAAAMICSMSGQSCTTTGRILLPRSRYAQGVELLQEAMTAIRYGDPWDPAVVQGPAISEPQRQKVLALVRSGIDSGATLLAGGGAATQLGDGYFIEPTLLTDVDPWSEVAQEEIFGPVVLVTPYDTDDEAVAIANNTIYGLSGLITSADEERALQLAARVRTGTISVNGGSWFGFTGPIGGYRQSGLGRRGGDLGFREYLEVKTIGLPVHQG